MKQLTYSSPTKIIFGYGCVKEIGICVSKYGGIALLVTAPKYPAIEKLYDRVKQSLYDVGVETFHFDGIGTRPTTYNITSGSDVAKRVGVNVIIGLGDDSCIDIAKAIAVESTHSGCAWDYLHYTNGPTEKTLPIIAINTLAETGSQTTSCANITNASSNVKSAIWSKNIFPRVAIVDQEVINLDLARVKITYSL